MVEYWPNKQGIQLNNEVARLFLTTKQKFSHNLVNTTNTQLYTDILDNSSRHKLFSTILVQLELLILDIIELDLSTNHIKLLNYKILCDLNQKSLNSFIKMLRFKNNPIKFIDQPEYFYSRRLLSEHRLILEHLLIYLTFGSSYVTCQSFIFNNQKTPKKHVAILLENLIIHVSNSVIFMLFESLKSLSNILDFLIHHQLCNPIFTSTRSLALFRNSLIWQNITYFYITQPRIIYNGRYQIWLINSGIQTKYIHISRLNDLPKLSTLKLLSIFLIEIQDLLLPKIENFLLILSRILLYILIHILGNSAIFIIRIITSNLYGIKK
uniref:Ycf55 n=1 Tax=Phyllymenia taiwanensis TaxID=1260292 RepID=R9XWV2_9FLOR|nr:Ycf55 [Grateloupia taiwanensis]AGO19957.1 Ycf55 [Grateloupia taiwanensis]